LTISAHHIADTLRRCWTCSAFGAWILALPPGDGTLFGTGVQGDVGAVAGDAEVGVLDVDGADLPGVSGADAQPLAGDHDDAVAGDLALAADRPGRR
jgi:hypothetical protein